jgi:6-pyruvoyl-tetrahydropterin synthase
MTEGSSSSTGGAEFEVFVGKEDFKFSSAHFVAFDGFRERLHGHNYQVAVRLKGQQVGRITYNLTDFLALRCGIAHVISIYIFAVLEQETCDSLHCGVALSQIAHDGYVIDFGDIKKITRKLCKELNEHFLCPQRSDVIDVQVADGQVTLQCQDGAKFSFPEVRTCATVPILRCCAVRLGLVSFVLHGTRFRCCWGCGCAGQAFAY